MPFFHQILRRKVLLAGNIGVILLLGWGLFGEIDRSQSLQADIDRLQSQAQTLEQQNAQLTALGKELATNDRLERDARVKLGLQKPGESVIIVQGDRGQSSPSTADVVVTFSPSATQLSNPQKWWKYFFNN